jgi:hypothetical protein
MLDGIGGGVDATDDSAATRFAIWQSQTTNTANSNWQIILPVLSAF